MRLFLYEGYPPVYPKDVTHVMVDESITSIRSRAFEHCQFLVSVIMHDGMDSIEEYAFIDCPRLRYLRVSKRLQHIGKYSFCSCMELQYLFLPKTLTSVERKAFYFCESLEFLVLPEEANIKEHTSEDFDATGLFVTIFEPMGHSYTYFRPQAYNRRFTTNNLTQRGDHGLTSRGETPSTPRSCRSMNRLFLTYMNEYPLHKICTDPSVSGIHIIEYLSGEHASDAAVIDRYHGMTALHILAMNPHTLSAPVAALFEFYTEAIFILDRHSKTPIDLAREFNVGNMLELINCLCLHRDRGED